MDDEKEMINSGGAEVKVTSAQSSLNLAAKASSSACTDSVDEVDPSIARDSDSSGHTLNGNHAELEGKEKGQISDGSVASSHGARKNAGVGRR